MKVDGYNLRYWGVFPSRGGWFYKVELYKKGEGDNNPVEVEFSDTPAILEWAKVDKFDPVQSSALTLHLISGSDRQFLELFSTDPEGWRVALFRSTQLKDLDNTTPRELFWHGYLDPELYSEPYTARDGYEVEITAGDFSTLDRMEWAERGTMRPLRWVVDECLGWLGRVGGYTSWLHMFTDVVEDFSVRTDNFFDEQGNPMTKREVLEEVLKPLGVQIRQYCGYPLIISPDALAIFPFSASPVVWDGTDARLGIDKVYNKVTVKLNTYDSENNLKYDLEKLLPPDGDGVGWHNVKFEEDKANLTAFKIYIGGNVDSSLPVPYRAAGDARMMRIAPEWSGEERAGVMWDFKMNRTGWVFNHDADYFYYKDDDRFPVNADGADTEIYPVVEVAPLVMPYVKGLSGGQRPGVSENEVNICLRAKILVDGRFNPFDGSDDLKLSYIGAPIRMYIRNEEGICEAYYSNIETMMRGAQSKWVAVPPAEGYVPPFGEAWLTWYDANDVQKGIVSGSFIENQQCIKYTAKKADILQRKRGGGEYIALPRGVSGEVVCEIGSGLWISVEGTHSEFYISNSGTKKLHKVIDNAKWICFSDIELVSANPGAGSKAENKEITYSATLDNAATDEFEINTTVGTPPATRVSMGARCRLFRKGDNGLMAVEELSRTGIAAPIEKHLVAAVYSQHAEPRITLSGDARFDDTLVYTDDAMAADKKFIVMSREVDLMRDCGNIELAEVATLNYMEDDGEV